MSNHTDSTVEWYINWLQERNPDWTDAQRLEVATGFSKSQQVPARPTEAEEDDPVEAMERITGQEVRKAERAEERKNRKYLTGKELMDILSTAGAVPKVN
jgi:hypothetical protein